MRPTAHAVRSPLMFMMKDCVFGVCFASGFYAVGRFWAHPYPAGKPGIGDQEVNVLLFGLFRI